MKPETHDAIVRYKAYFNDSPPVWNYMPDWDALIKAIDQAIKDNRKRPDEDVPEGVIL